MEIKFTKYSATGNDFIVLDNRNNIYDGIPSRQWESICQRRSGVGADGVLFLENSSECDFSMRYLNADGGEVSMCGNGARALTHFASVIFDKKSFSFETKNGVYHSNVDDEYLVRIQMTERYDEGLFDLSDFNIGVNSFYINTGVPHCLFEVEDIENIDLMGLGKKVRYDKRFKKGANANFFQKIGNSHIRLRTYERGVEAETDACGTGATAVAIFASKLFGIEGPVEVHMNGGVQKIEYSKNFDQIFLCGEARKIYKASLCL